MSGKIHVKSTIAILLISSMALTIIALPNANAASTGKAYPFVDAVPNPVGVNQYTLINMGALNFLNTENDGWNVTVTITKPDGTVDTIGPFKTFSTGTYGKNYLVTEVGTYTLQTNFLEQTYNGVTYAAAESAPLTLVATAEPQPSYPSQPLPSEYWGRPVDSQLRDWYTIMGSWLSKPLNLYAPYNDGPESAHILWSTPVGDMMGGLVGGGTDGGGMVAGGTGDHGYEIGDAYEGKFSGSIIISGVLYYNKYISGNPQQEVVAIDLHTGKVLWDKTLLNNLRIGFGQTIFWDSRNNRASFSYLVCTSGGGFGGGSQTWYYFDALTGNLQFNMTNVPGGTNYYGPNGEILKYSYVNYGNTTNPNWHLLQWNSSYVVQNGKTGMSESWGSQVLGVSYDAGARGYDRNVSIPQLNVAGGRLPGSAQMAFINDKLIGASVSQTEVDLWAISLSDSNMGTLLYNTTWAAPAEWVQGNITIGGIGQSGWCAWSPADEVGVYFTKENRVHYGFNLNTGTYMWQTAPQKFQDAWSDTVTLTFGPDRVIAYGMLYSGTVGGTVYAYNITTGDLVWNYNSTDYYHESYIGNDWWTVPVCVTDGKLYFGTMEHSPLDPKPRGAPFYCLNATDGSLIWRADGLFRQTRWGGRGLIGDSIIATMDTYDQQIYAIGMGPSATTVDAPKVSSPANTPITLTGTIMDVSPGTQQDLIKLRFPNGVPAVSDDSMSDWMLYVYKQFALPSNCSGVQVQLTAYDSNMNPINIGTATSDWYGNYGISWTPTTAGTYAIVATFQGSKAYYGSTATTYLTVGPAPEPPAQQPQQAIPDYTLAIVGMGIVVLLAVAIVGVMLYRKKA
jgi:outer membrane protein assembly factor BamB